MTRARVFTSGKSQAILLPEEFRVTGVELEIFRRGDEIILREMAGGLEQAFDLIGDLPDFDREDGPAQERGDLSRSPRRQARF
jgi:antitoxin VapB